MRASHWIIVLFASIVSNTFITYLLYLACETNASGYVGVCMCELGWLESGEVWGQESSITLQPVL